MEKISAPLYALVSSFPAGEASFHEAPATTATPLPFHYSVPSVTMGSQRVASARRDESHYARRQRLRPRLKREVDRDESLL